MKGLETYEFFLGGQDLEMVTVGELLQQYVPDQVHDHRLRWGARVSDYQREIRSAMAAGKTPVLVELENDLQIPNDQVLVIDHHGDRAGAKTPTALEQIFALLNLPASAWSRWHDLVAANDRGHLKGLQEVGASLDEMRRVRAADRAAQGIGEAEEAAAAEAVAKASTFCGGRLHVVRLPHSRTSAVVDRMETELGGPGFENLLVLSLDETNFFGDGRLVKALDRQFPGGWYGGALPEQGFWGIRGEADGIQVFIEDWLTRETP